jgi:hypothetical protein
MLSKTVSTKTMLTLATALVLGAASATLALGAADAKTNPAAHMVAKPGQFLPQPMLPKQTDTNPSNGTLDWVVDHAKGFPS